jgi:uncharacterized membrane protein YphA (DoxX/SURF4 family)
MNQINRPPFAKRAMNAALWTIQILSGVFWTVTGFGKIFWYNTTLWNQARHEVAWFSAVGQGLLIFIGACEFLGGIGLILPAISRVKPKLTPYAAFGLALIMIFAAVFHTGRGEYNFLITNLVFGVVAALIGYERMFVRPIAPGPVSTRRALSAVAVLGALILLDYAPVWYRLTQIH